MRIFKVIAAMMPKGNVVRADQHRESAPARKTDDYGADDHGAAATPALIEAVTDDGMRRRELQVLQKQRENALALLHFGIGSFQGMGHAGAHGAAADGIEDALEALGLARSGAA